jgi:hypothetical protein
MKTKCPDCCYPEVLDSDACGCCEGVEAVTPLPTANRPGLSKIVYRIGTHASFLETMMARLSNHDHPELSPHEMPLIRPSHCWMPGQRLPMC